MRSTALTTKPHYQILDSLRGVASIAVIVFHLFEAHAASPLVQVINHGYLAVDFFFMLSGFVVGYAYDDRWSGGMGIVNFFKLRLIRLQPMVVLGMIVGAVCFYFQDSILWPAIHAVPVWRVLLLMLIGFILLPVPVSMDIRGWQEMHPLNGPEWSLFFEYIVNILYAAGLRKLSKPALSLLVGVAGCALIWLAVTNGDLIGGWSLTPGQLRIGATRVMFPFFAGLLLSRTGKMIRVKRAFLWCSLLLLLVFCLPRFGGTQHAWMNGLYESCCVIFLFPVVVLMGAGGTMSGRRSAATARLLGDISYPLYITHYPLIYIYTAWVSDHQPDFQQAFPVALGTFAAGLLLAYASLKWYDEPVRKWLKKRIT